MGVPLLGASCWIPCAIDSSSTSLHPLLIEARRSGAERISGGGRTLIETEVSLLLLFKTTRMVPGTPSTGVAIAMDGGMADTAC